MLFLSSKFGSLSIFSFWNRTQYSDTLLVIALRETEEMAWTDMEKYNFETIKKGR
jgi:hypothetical protein